MKSSQIRGLDTHTGELDATVTALGSGTLLLEVLVSQLAAGGLDDADAVGPCVVPVRNLINICPNKT